MTEPTYDPIIDEARQARLVQLQARKAVPPTARTSSPKRRTAHPGHGARLTAAGFGIATMLGLVGAMGIANRPTGASSASDEVVAEAGPTPIVIVVHQQGTSGDDTTEPATTALPTRRAPTKVTVGATSIVAAEPDSSVTTNSTKPSTKTSTKKKTKKKTKSTTKSQTKATSPVTVQPKPKVTAPPATDAPKKKAKSRGSK